MITHLLLLATIFAGSGLVLSAIFSAIVEMIIAFDDRRTQQLVHDAEVTRRWLANHYKLSFNQYGIVRRMYEDEIGHAI